MAVNVTDKILNYDDLLRTCWRLSDCQSCLKSRYPCGWCPVSNTCIPNETPSAWLLPVLNPFLNPDICPHWAERWELRAKPTMCHVSTVTFVSVTVAAVSTIVVIFLIFILVILFRCICNRRRQRRIPPNLLVIDTSDADSAVADERTSLLGRFRRGTNDTSGTNGSLSPPSSGISGPKRRQSFWVYNTMPASAASTQSKPPPTPRLVTSSDGNSGQEDTDSVHEGNEGGRASTRHEWEERRRQLLGRRGNVEQ